MISEIVWYENWDMKNKDVAVLSSSGGSGCLMLTKYVRREVKYAVYNFKHCA